MHPTKYCSAAVREMAHCDDEDLTEFWGLYQGCLRVGSRVGAADYLRTYPTPSTESLKLKASACMQTCMLLWVAVRVRLSLKIYSKFLLLS